MLTTDISAGADSPTSSALASTESYLGETRATLARELARFHRKAIDKAAIPPGRARRLNTMHGVWTESHAVVGRSSDVPEQAADIPTAYQFRFNGRPQKQVEEEAPFRVTHRYEGRVIAVGDMDFDAIVEEKAFNQGEHAEVRIPLSAIDPNDSRLVFSGSVFYWLFGYRLMPYRRDSSILSFAGYRPLSVDLVQENLDRINELFDAVDGQSVADLAR